ncbi:MAG: AsmA family protein [Sphingobium sp.]
MHDARTRWRGFPLPVRIVGYIVLAMFLVWLVLFVTKGRFLKQPFERIATSTLERDVSVGGDFQLYFAPFHIKFMAEEMAVDNPSWASKDHLFRADLIDTRIASLPLIIGNLRFRDMAIVKGDIDLEWSRDGKSNSWTMGDSDAKAEPFHLPDIRRGVVRGTTLRYRDPRLTLSTDVAIDTVRAKDTRFSDDIGFHGDGRMNGRAFTLSGNLLSPNETLDGGRNRLSLKAASGSTHLAVNGTLPSATQIEGADLKTEIWGSNLRFLFDFLGIAVPDTRDYRVHSNLTYENESWKFTQMKGRFGGSDLAGRMTISLPNDRLHIGADLSTNTLDIIDIGPFIGYEPNALATQGVQAAVKQTGGAPRILPDAPLRIDAVSRFDADVKYAVKQVKGKDLPISNIGLTLKLDKSLMTLSPLTFDMAGGFVSSDISIDARKQPVSTKYDIRLSPTPMGKLLGRWGVEESGTTGTLKARVQMTGEGDSVRDSLASADGRIAIIMPAGTMWARNIQLSELDIGVFIQKMFEKKLKDPVEINCGLIAFTVRDGVAAADPILIDTKKNVMTGRGNFSFKDESLDLSVRADGKKFSLFSAQSPIGVGGHFAAPSVNVITPELLARAGAGAGLGAVLTPIASILAFVDVGDAKSAACGPVLSGAQANAQRTKKGKPRDDVGKGKPDAD